MDFSQQAILIYALTFVAVYIFVRYGWFTVRAWLLHQEAYYDRVLNQQLLLNINTRLAIAMTIFAIFMFALIGYMLGGVVWFIPAAVAGGFVPWVLIRHLDQKRRERLEAQLVDGITTLASGVRAGLTLVQAMELLVKNHIGPMAQEFSQLLREYQMGLDLNHAMRNTANRVGLSNYRLLFTAIEMHRLRGGNTGESLDRICDSIREIQRLEGKLDAITAQGRLQATFIAVGAVGLLGMFYFIDPDNMRILFVEPLGRVVLLIAGLIMLGAFRWIRKIMAVDI